MKRGPTIPCWLREHHRLDATDKYLYLCLLDVLGEERLENMLVGRDKGDIFCTIDFLLAYTGLEETALRKSFLALMQENLVYKYHTNEEKLWEICMTPWGKALGIRQKTEGQCDCPQEEKK